MRLSPLALFLLTACPSLPEDTGDTGPDVDTELDTEADTGMHHEPEVRRYDCGGIEPADAGPLGGRVTLTFDDGPHSEHTAALLAKLDARGIPATFMVLGERLEDPENWDVVEAIVDNPLFDLGNHSYDHSNLSTLSLSAAAAQMDDTTELIESFDTTTPWFRFPYGDSTCATADLARSRDMRLTGWHIDTGDWCYAAVGVEGVCLQEDYWRIPTEYEADMRGFILEQANRYDGGILLFHDIHAWTVDIIDEVIDDLENAGFTFVSLSDTATYPNLNANTPADLPYLGEACDTANDLCFHSEYFAWCEPTDPDDASSTTGICTMECEGLCPDRDGAATTFCAQTEPGFGQCLAHSSSINEECALLPGTSGQMLLRHVGDSGAAAANATVCVP